MTSRKPREEVEWFADEMELTLQANDHKGSWRRRGISEASLFDHLLEETRELLDELHRVPKDPDRIISEATDVACLAMMIADRQRGRG